MQPKLYGRRDGKVHDHVRATLIVRAQLTCAQFHGDALEFEVDHP
ncbi:hypothetical protein BC1002_4186 [Paraburkholderia atlantica]|uniref:Uncharacterized protein n=1 Tax=Paraburkholderia atlantica TaxID=2654982 RepID=D5WI86_PARAM|nr:hypothetical protein BC1002_4186 [Paraburkholderia atlantica]